jgi:hypothetical protein
VLAPTAPEVSFGAAGHLWVTVAARDLVDDGTVVLPESAPPLVVRVREEDGSPAPGVPVEVLPALPGPVRRTGSGGTVVFDDLAPGLVTVSVGGTERRGPTLRVVVGEESDRTAILERPWRVRGRVVDAAGTPRVGARVTGATHEGALGAPATTVTDGRFEWVGPASHRAALAVAAPGLAEVAIEVEPPPVGPLVTEVGDVVVASLEGRLDGRVRSARLGASARVVVEPEVAAILRELFGPSSATIVPRVVPIAPDGSFQVTGLPTRMPLRVTVLGAGVPVDELVEATVDPRPFEVEVPAGETLRVRVIDGVTGAPAAGLGLLLSRRPLEGDRPGPEDVVLSTDAEGRALAEGLPPGAHFVRAYARGRRSLLKRLDLPQGEQVLRLETALVDEGRRVRGAVVDERGVPLEGVTLRAAAVVTTSDAEGRFVLEGVESLSPTVTLSAAYEPGAVPAGAEPGPHAGTARLDVVPGAPPVRVVLPRTATLRFRALDGLDDAPLSCFHVLLQTDDGTVLMDRAVATEDGSVEVRDLPPRGVTLALHAHARRYFAPVPLEPGAVRDLGVVRLDHGFVVRGTVTLPGGAPAAGAQVALLGEGWLATRGTDPGRERDLGFRRVRAGADGGYVLEGLDPSRPALLAAFAPGSAVAVRRIVPSEVPLGEHARLDVRLEPGGHLVLHARVSETREPVLGAALDLEDARNGVHFLDLVHRAVLGGSAGSSDDWRHASEQLLHERGHPGTYHVGPVTPGPYEAWVEHPLFRPARLKLTVLPPGEFVAGPIDPDAAVGVPGTLALLVHMEPLEPR